MIRIILVLLISIIAFNLAEAQVVVKEPATVTQMLERYKEINKRTTRISGYRILIYSTSDRRSMENMLRRFQYSYPNINVDWVHDPPDYKIRAGAFETKLDAQRLLYIIRKDYPDASVMIDNRMNPSELIF